ncbi:MAG: hypothetical protein GWP32_08825 [Bacteroidetes bacterium]|nr:hypothetical protein [Bacteroidota bacterium]
MKIYSLYFIFLLFFVGCESSKTEVSNIDSSKLELPPPIPNFTPNIVKLSEVQINEIPHPFNINGHIPCVIWVNGKRLNISPLEAQKLAKAVDLSSRPKIHASRLHSGEGWAKPLSVTR